MIRRVAKWLGCLLLVAATARSEIPSGYYASAEGKSGEDLRRALHLIIRGHHVIPYSDSTRLDTSDALKELDQDPKDTNNGRDGEQQPGQQVLRQERPCRF